MKKQKGSSHVILVIVLVGVLISVLGWVFWQNFIHKDGASKDDQNMTSSQQTNTSTKSNESTSGAVDTENWLFTSEVGVNFPGSIRLPDGWKLLRIVKSGDRQLYGIQPSDLKYDKGSAATLVESTGGFDDWHFYVGATKPQTVTAKSVEKSRFKAGTSDVVKYQYTQTAEDQRNAEEAGGVVTAAGTTEYIWKITNSGTKAHLDIYLRVDPGQNDLSAFVEENIVKTSSLEYGKD